MSEPTSIFDGQDGMKQALRFIEVQQTKILDLKSAHADMVKRCALLRERPDLPVDRIPAYAELAHLQSVVGELSADVDRLEAICVAAYSGLGASYDLPLRFLDVLCDPLEATQEQIDALLPVDTAPPVAKLERVRELIQARIDNYYTYTKDPDDDDFICAEWALAALQHVLNGFDLIMSDASAS